MTDPLATIRLGRCAACGLALRVVTVRTHRTVHGLGCGLG